MSMTKWSGVVRILMFTGTAMAGCESDGSADDITKGGDTPITTPDGSASSSRNSGMADTNTSDSAASSGGASGAPGTATQTGPIAALTAPQIAAITSTVNKGEISMGELALERSRDAPVREYAQMMIDMHTAAESRQLALLQQLAVTPAENPVSVQLQRDADVMASDLQDASDADFDTAYVEGQRDVHAKVLTLVDEQLIPSAREATLRDELTKTRGEVQQHLDLAEQLLAQREVASGD
ncbi:MAG: DUF4142 domain-containing protein [Polyangiales bacterium]